MRQYRSIDAAVFGYVRQRFVRAFRASIVVLAAVLVIALMGIALRQQFASSFADGVTMLVFGLPLIFVCLYFPIVFLVGFVGAVTDVVHRRLTALVLLGCAGYAGSYLAWLGYWRAVSWMGASRDQQIDIAATLIFCLIGALIALECVLHALWQLLAGADDFRGARGWRPSPWRLMATFRRSLGLPAFIASFGRGRLSLSLLYFLVAVLNLGVMAMIFLPIFAVPTDGALSHPVTVYVLAGLLVLDVLGAGRLFVHLAEKRATRIYQNVREWDSRKPIVFLRTFDQDDARLPATGGDPFAKWAAGVGRARTLDEILLEHGTPYGPVIAIGDPREATPPLGAARVFVKERGDGWQDVVKGLVDASKAVVMCPNDTQGVKWELDLVAKEQGINLIYLANPELTRETNAELFQHLAPNGEAPDIPKRQHVVAAYVDPKSGWRVLTARKPSVGAYTAALNIALQNLFGVTGEWSEPTKET